MVLNRLEYVLTNVYTDNGTLPLAAMRIHKHVDCINENMQQCNECINTCVHIKPNLGIPRHKYHGNILHNTPILLERGLMLPIGAMSSWLIMSPIGFGVAGLAARGFWSAMAEIWVGVTDGVVGVSVKDPMTELLPAAAPARKATPMPPKS
mgnify:CR=1 FL=1